MNGSEVLTQNKPEPSLYSYDQNLELTDLEKMELTIFAQMPQFKTVCKLFEGIIIGSRNRACDISPSEPQKQAAELTIAHAQKKMYEDFRSTVLFHVNSHITDVKQKVAEESLKEREVLEDIILKNSRGEV